jgi:cell division protein FtsQ
MINLQLPRLRYDRIYWMLFLLITVVILIGAIVHKKNSFPDSVEVTVEPLRNGEKLISEGDVKQALMRAFGNDLENTEMARLDVERMERVMEEDPFVRDADTYIDQKNVLHVTIQQRAPLLRILDSNGGNYYLDEKGVKMPPSKNFTARVIVATGNITPYTPEFLDKKKNTLKDLFKLTQILEADEFLATFIQQIHVNNAGEFSMVPLVGNQRIILGTVRRLDDKIRRLKIFYQQAMPYTGWKQYQTINLKFSGQVVCKK